MVRTIKNAIFDKLVTLYIISRTREIHKHTVLGIVKLQKLLFLSELELLKNNLNSLDYTFCRWKQGPMSQEVYSDHDELIMNDLISDGEIKTTEQGKDVIKEVQPLIKMNQKIFNVIDKIIKKYGNKNSIELMRIAYNIRLKTDRGVMKIEDIPENIKMPILIDKDAVKMNFEKNWLETIDFLLDSELRNFKLEEKPIKV